MPDLSFLAALGLSRVAAGHVPRRTTMKRSLLSVAALAALGFAGDRGYDYWKDGRFQQSTNNAYLRADYTTVAPRLSGYIVEVLVHDNEPVRTGQVLARIDERQYRVAVDEAMADVAMADAMLVNLDAQVAQQQSVLDQERAEVTHQKASAAYAKSDNQRYEELKKAGYGSVQRASRPRWRCARAWRTCARAAPPWSAPSGTSTCSPPSASAPPPSVSAVSRRCVRRS